MPGTTTLNNKTVSPEAKVKASLPFEVAKQSMHNEEIAVPHQALETLSEDKFDEPEAENDAVSVMDTNDESFDQNVQIEIGQAENMIFKAENEDMADTLTDIDELLRDELKEGDMVPVAEIKEQVLEEALKMNTKSDLSLDDMTGGKCEKEDNKDIKETGIKLAKDIENLAKDIKVEDNPRDDIKFTEVKTELETDIEAERETMTNKQFETIESKQEEEMSIKSEEVEKAKGEISEEQMKIEKESDVEENAEVVSECTNYSAEEKTKTEDVKNLQKVIEVEPSHEPNNEKNEETAIDANSMVGVDGVESAPCTPPTPSIADNVTATPPASTTSTTPPSAAQIHSTPDEDKEYKVWKKSIILVWGQIAQHKNANLFAGAVSEADAPEYRYTNICAEQFLQI